MTIGTYYYHQSAAFSRGILFGLARNIAADIHPVCIVEVFELCD